MPNKTIIEQRNKALISLCLLTCPRIKALSTARICSIRYFVEYEAWDFDQHPKLIDTKRKSSLFLFVYVSAKI